MKHSANHCFACREPNSGRETISIVNRVCHRECFKCQICRQDLNSRMFCMFMGEIYCEKHHPNMRRRNDSITKDCNRSLGSLDRMERDEGSHCSCKKLCFICRLVVDEPRPLKGPGGVYHGGCFRCTICQKILDPAQYRVVKCKFYCEPACNSVNKDKPEQLNGITKQHNNIKSEKVRQKMNTVCSRCSKEVGNGEMRNFFEKVFHKECFRCIRCNRLLTESHCVLVDDLPCCSNGCDEKTISRPNLPNIDHKEKNAVDHKSNSLLLPKQEKNQSKSEKSPKVGRKSCVANAEKVAKIQRQLEKIQSTALEDKNCYTCGKKVYPAEQLNTLNRIYHLKCFQCKVCQKCLSNKYQILDGNPYCIPHYKQLNNMKSQSALNLSTNSLIDGKSRAVGHMDPFEENFRQRSDVLPVRDDLEFETRRTSVCCVCSRRILQGAEVKVKNRTFHRTCFRCKTCQNLLDVDSYATHDGIPYCDTHFRAMIHNRSSKRTSVQSNNLNETSKPTCPDNSQSRRKGQAPQETEDIVKCYSCGTKVYQAEQLNILKRTYHRTCFKCATCQKVLSVSRYNVHEGVPYCTAHHRQIGTQLATIKVEFNNAKANRIVEENNEHHVADGLDSKNHPMNHSPTPLSEKTSSLSRTRCFECGKYTNPKNSLILTDRVYHTECLKCNTCQKALGKWNFKEIEGLIFCSRHYNESLVTHSTEKGLAPLQNSSNIAIYQSK